MNSKPERPKQEVPADLVNRLMGVVRAQFCGDLDGAEWGKHSHFVRRNVIMWPAHFMCNAKGFTLPAARYEAIMRSIFAEIKRHGQTGEIRYWPGYLMKCVQDHWKHHWEEYYEEAKASQNLASATLIALGKLPEKSDRTVESIAQAHKILTAKTPRKKVFKLVEPRLPGF